MIFRYWGIRGAGQVPRLVLAYTGVQWEDKHYADREEWFGKDKPSLNMDFPNLPCLVDGDFKISESSAIPRYIINKSGKTELLGKTIHDQAKVDEFNGVLGDVRQAIGPLFWDKQWAAKKDAAWQKAKPKLDLINKFIGDKEFVLGYLTLADFNLAEFSYYVEKIWPEQFNHYEGIKRVRTSFNNLPQIKAYYEKQTSVKGPFAPQGMAAIPF